MGFWQFATGGGSGGGTGDVVGPASSTDNAVARWDLATGKLLQDSGLIVSDVAAGAITVTSTAGTAITLKNTDPAATTGASVAGDVLSLTAGNAVASTDTAGAAAGGAVTITAGNAARNTSGNANGGDINLTTGAGIGTGTTGNVVLPSAAQLTISTDTGLARSAAGQIKVTDGSTGYGKLLVRNDGGSSLVGIAFGGTTNSQPALAANGDELWVVGAADPYGQFNTLRAATLKASIFQQVNDGIYGDSGGLTIASGNGFLFSNGATAPGTPDVGLKRSAAGVAIISGGTSGIGKLLNAVLVEANTAGSGTPNAIAANESGTTFTNEGVTAKNYEALPTAAAGYQYTFIVQDADGMRIVANTDDTIRVIDKVTATAGYIESTTIGSTVTLVSINAVEWYATSIKGTWTDGTFTYDDTSLTTP